MPGVILVFTAKDAAEQTTQVASFSSPPVPQYCMAIEKIRHVGEAVAAVVAEDPYIAEDAIDLIEVEYEPLPHVDPEKAIHATGAAVLHPDRGPTNCAYDQEFKFGPVDEDFAKAEVVVRRKVKWSRSGAQPIETVGAIAEFDEGTRRFTYHANTNFYNVVNFVIAGALKVPPTHLKIIPTIAGGSSDRSFSPTSVALTCALARAAERPVKYIEDRIDNLLNAMRTAATASTMLSSPSSATERCFLCASASSTTTAHIFNTASDTMERAGRGHGTL